jgi:hypothetical protein
VDYSLIVRDNPDKNKTEKHMTKQAWKIQFGKIRRDINQASKFETIASFGGKKQMKKAVREIQATGYKLLEQAKIESDLYKVRAIEAAIYA